MVSLKLLAAISPLATMQVSAWGPLGHATVASVAMHFLLPETQVRVNQILKKDPAPFVTITTTAPGTASATSTSAGPSTSLAARSASNKVPTLVDIASWADDFRFTPEGAFSAALHYVDAEDSPPQKCNVKINRDCTSGGCIISAIANYTERVQDHSLDATERARALKWVTHFLGDIQQPLHDEALALGGNQISVFWNGTVNNLHHIWDYEIITKYMGDFNLENVDKWTKKITKELGPGGTYFWRKWDWVSCDDIDDAESCAVTWAREANSYVCSYVLKTDPSNKELSTDYAAGAFPIIDMQIAKGGVRLAAWLNTIFAGWPGFF